MPEVIFPGPAGRLEGRYQPPKTRNGRTAIVLHPHPQFGGTMNNPIVYELFYMFQKRGFGVLRFNFRGVGRSQGAFDQGHGWIAGFSFGAWIGMQLLMRRPEVEGFMSVALQPNLYDFSFLAPCPSSGLIIHGEQDRVAPLEDVDGLIEKLKTQKGIVIDKHVIANANHFFEGHQDELLEGCANYLDRRLAEIDAEQS